MSPRAEKERLTVPSFESIRPNRILLHEDVVALFALVYPTMVSTNNVMLPVLLYFHSYFLAPGAVVAAVAMLL